MIRFILLTILIGYTPFSFGQNKKKKPAEPAPTSLQPSSLSPNTTTQGQQSINTKAKTKSKRPKLEVTYDAERKYYQRAKRVAKEQIKAEKESQKPQYSDPMYFGHKRPPKKRPLGKQKFCKVCGMKH